MKGWMDGSHKELLVTGSSHVSKPTGLAIDEQHDTLYYLDTYRHLVGYINIHTGHVQILIRDSSYIVNPFAVSVFKVITWTPNRIVM